MYKFEKFAERFRQYKPLTYAQEEDAIKKYRLGDKKAGDLLINCNARFALQMAHKYSRFYHLEIDDAFQAATLGMLKARERFDPSFRCRFISYASHYIHASLQSLGRKQRWLVNRGTTWELRALLSKLPIVKVKIESIYPGISREELYDRCAAELECDYETVKSLDHRIHNSDVSLDKKTSDRRSRELEPGEQIQIQSDWPSPLELAEEFEKARGLREKFDEKVKKPIERDIIETRLFSDDPDTLEGIGIRHGISRERIRQIECSLIRRVVP